MTNKILEVLKNMDDSELVYIWNEYCMETNHGDDIIMDAYELEEWANAQKDTMSVLNRFYFGHDEENENTSANPNRNYFCFNGYANIVSFDYIYNEYTNEFYNMDADALVDYIVENNNSFDNDEIEEILESVEEE